MDAAMPGVSRRNFLAMAAFLPRFRETSFGLAPADEEFLEDLSRRNFQYFWEQVEVSTGLVLDRSRCDGTLAPGRNLRVASTALTGFYLTALCIGAERKWKPVDACRERVRVAMRYLLRDQQNVRGWFYHFVDQRSGERVWNCEISTIDTAFLLAGVITAQQYFGIDAEILRLAQELYERVDFPWMYDQASGRLRMGWTPEAGFLNAEWTDYDENSILSILAIASPANGLPETCWYTFRRVEMDLCGYRFVGRGPLFTHQYSQAWLHLADLRDGAPFQIDYFRNSIVATYAFRALWQSLRSLYPGFDLNVWGNVPSDSNVGYVVWGSPTSRRDMDGTVAPSAMGGSLMFAPEICLPGLRKMRERFSDWIYGPYGFTDAFNPMTHWANPDVVGINTGMTLVSAENLRSGNVWRWFGRSVDIRRAMGRIFEPDC
ncbi:MAG: hypothetical protein M3Y57_16125 [Acidobacteriota bacterium]|nr:hypothetical protein [Acidobacteriota bacterium]